MSVLHSRGRLAWLAAVCVALAAGTASPSVAQAPQRDLEKLHVLLVIDTNVRELRDSILIDKGRMQRLLASTIPAGRYELKTLTGSAVSEKAVLQYYRELKPGPQDGLLFYYAGHGATDPRLGEHYFFLQEKNPLLRSTVRRAMVAKRTSLVVLCTDCCSNALRIPRRTRDSDFSRAATEIHPVMRSLFFRQRGLVDITASTGNSSWGDDDRGGLFTYSLQKVILSRSLEERARHGSLGWGEFFPLLQRETEQTFSRWAKQQRARGENIDQLTQRPHAFTLPGAGGDSERAFAAVSIRNDKAQPVTYQWRWSADSAWQSCTLAPRGSRLHTQALSAAGRGLPQLEVMYGKARKTKRLEAARSAGPPGPEQAAKYHFGKGKTTRSLNEDAEDGQGTAAEEGKKAAP